MTLLVFQCSPRAKIQPGDCTSTVAEQIVSDDYFRRSRKESINDYKLITQDKGEIFEIKITLKEQSIRDGDQMIMHFGGGATYQVSKNDCRIVSRLFGQ